MTKEGKLAIEIVVTCFAAILLILVMNWGTAAGVAPACTAMAVAISFGVFMMHRLTLAIRRRD